MQSFIERVHNSAIDRDNLQTRLRALAHARHRGRHTSTNPLLAMTSTSLRTVCWYPTWSKGHEKIGLEHLVLASNVADSVILAIDEDGNPFRLNYHLAWDQAGCLVEADLDLFKDSAKKSMNLRADGKGHWRHVNGQSLPKLEGCIDIDIWPTPFTNSLPLWRTSMSVNEKQEFLMAWVSGPDLTVEAKSQTYSRLGERRYLFESLDGSSFQAELELDEDGLVLDYPGLFRRVDV